MIERSFVTAAEVAASPTLRRSRAGDHGGRCQRTIELDAKVYRCWRPEHDGIHDAFTTHGDGGEVRW